MKTLALALLLAQDVPVERLLDQLESDTIEERIKAEAELIRRGRAAVRAIVEAQKRAADPDTRKRLHAVLETLVGAKILTPERLKSVRLTYERRDRTLGQALDELDRAGGVGIVLDSKSSPDLKLPALSFTDQPLDTVLDTLARAVGGCWFLDGERILFAAPEKVPLRLFDVRDLTEPVLDDPWIPLGAQPLDPDSPPESGDRNVSFLADDLASLIREAVRPASWEEAEGFSCGAHQGYLIVRNEATVLAEVETYLARVRRDSLLELRVEIEAYACIPGGAAGEDALDALRRASLEGKTARTLARFEQTIRAGRRVAFRAATRRTVVLRPDPAGDVVRMSFAPGAALNLRPTLSDDRARVRVELAAGFTRVLTEGNLKAGEPSRIAEHVLKSSETVPAGKPVLLGRLTETRMAEGLPEIAVFGRFTVVPR